MYRMKFGNLPARTGCSERPEGPGLEEWMPGPRHEEWALHWLVIGFDFGYYKTYRHSAWC